MKRVWVFRSRYPGPLYPAALNHLLDQEETYQALEDLEDLDFDQP